MQRRGLLLALGLVAATLVVYAPALGHGFVGVDDGTYVSANPRVAAGLGAEGLRWAFTTFHAGNWHPLTWISHQLDAQLFGLAPAGHHATSIVLHALAAALLFAALRSLTGRALVSAFTAALFALHPQRVESVAWVAERKDVLSGLCFGATLWLWAAYARRGGATRYTAVALALVLGLLAKPTLVTLPFLLLLLDVWPLGRLRGGPPAAAEEPASVRGIGGLLLEKLPLFALCAIASWLTLRAQISGGALAADDVLPAGERLANAVVSAVRYLGQALWPTDLAVFYPHPSLVGEGWSPVVVLGAAALLAAASVAVLRGWRRRPHLAVGWLWYLGMLVPVLGLVQVGPQAMADRYTYLPLIGPVLAVSVEVARRAASAPGLRAAASVFAPVALLACGVTTVRQVGVWRDTESLALHALEATDRNAFAHHLLAVELVRSGRLDDALVHYRRAIELAPGVTAAHYNLANALERHGDVEGALVQWRSALRIDPDHFAARFNLAGALWDAGRVPEAAWHYRETARLRPDRAETHAALGDVRLVQGLLQAALGSYDAALRIAPGLEDVERKRQVALERLGRARLGAHAMQERLVEDPTDTAARASLARALIPLGELVRAEGELGLLLQGDPDSASWHAELGNVHLRQGRLEEARGELELALALAPDHALALRGVAELDALRAEIDAVR